MKIQLNRLAYLNVNGDDLIDKLFKKKGIRLVSNYLDAHLIVFGGGADVNPRWYRHPVHKTTRFSEAADHRDKTIFGHVKSDQYVKIGICRGAQFLNVMNGGTLYQDVSCHTDNHDVIYNSLSGEKLIYEVTSTHHQMMRLSSKVKTELWGHINLSGWRDTGYDHRKVSDFVKEGPDPEIVFFPENTTLCFQPHPEYLHEETEELFWKCVQRAVDFSFNLKL